MMLDCSAGESHPIRRQRRFPEKYVNRCMQCWKVWNESEGKAERRVERSISGGDRVGEEVGGEGKKGESQNLKEQLVKAELFF